MANYADVPRRRDALTERMGHHASELLIAAIFATIILGLYPPPGLLGLTVSLTLIAFVILSFLLMRQHDRRLCEACMAAMPLNPAERAVRYKYRFKLAHLGGEPRFFIPYLIVLIGSNFEIEVIGRFAWAAIQLTMIYLILAQSTHRRLQPWCPECQGGGGGVDELDTPPVLPHDDRQLV
jgi:hypothetical protein